MNVPDFLVIGHVVKDVAERGWRLGGTVTYAAVQASRLGLRAGVVTRAAADVDLEQLLPDIDVSCVPSESTTTFENRYERGRRVQRVWAQAPAIGVEDVPEDWQGARIVLLGPVLDEVPVTLAGLFPQALVGFCPQGWLREVRPGGLVSGRRWLNGAPLEGVDVVSVSEEDLVNDGEALLRWQREAPVVVVTGGKGGAMVCAEGRERRIRAFPHREVDPTGAGDVFAAAFVVAFAESRDVAASARFATAAAGLSVEAAGTERVATRVEIERVLAEHPEIVLE